MESTWEQNSTRLIGDPLGQLLTNGSHRLAPAHRWLLLSQVAFLNIFKPTFTNSIFTKSSRLPLINWKASSTGLASDNKKLELSSGSPSWKSPTGHLHPTTSPYSSWTFFFPLNKKKIFLGFYVKNGKKNKNKKTQRHSAGHLIFFLTFNLLHIFTWSLWPMYAFAVETLDQTESPMRVDAIPLLHTIVSPAPCIVSDPQQALNTVEL